MKNIKKTSYYITHVLQSYIELQNPYLRRIKRTEIIQGNYESTVLKHKYIVILTLGTLLFASENIE